MKCPYSEIQCVYLETAGMSQAKECSTCEHRDKGIRSTGAMPDLGLIERLKKLFRKKVKINGILANGRHCNECYFGHSEGAGQWSCDTKLLEKYNLPDCVFDFPIDSNVIYVKDDLK